MWADAIHNIETNFYQGKASFSREIIQQSINSFDKKLRWSHERIGFDVASVICSPIEDFSKTTHNVHEILTNIHALSPLPSSEDDIYSLSTATLFLSYEYCRLEMIYGEPSKACYIAKESFEMVFLWLFGQQGFKEYHGEFRGLVSESLFAIWQDHNNIQTSPVMQFQLAVNRMALAWCTCLIKCSKLLDAKMIVDMYQKFNIQTCHHFTLIELIIRIQLPSNRNLSTNQILSSFSSILDKSQPQKELFASVILRGKEKPLREVLLEVQCHLDADKQPTPNVLNMKGMIKVYQGEYEAALELFKCCLKASPMSLEPIYNIAAVYWMVGSRQEALKLLLHIIIQRNKRKRSTSTLTPTRTPSVVVLSNLNRQSLLSKPALLQWTLVEVSMACREWASSFAALEHYENDVSFCNGSLASSTVSSIAQFSPLSYSSSFRSPSSFCCSASRLRTIRIELYLHMRRYQEALQLCIQSLESSYPPFDVVLLLHTADALLSLGKASIPHLDEGNGTIEEEEGVLGTDKRWTVSSLLKQAGIGLTTGTQEYLRADYERLQSILLNNQALELMKSGNLFEAEELLQRAAIVSPANEYRPLFNLVLLLWRQPTSRDRSAQIWITRRFPTISGNSSEKVDLDLEHSKLIREAIATRCRLLEQQPLSHVPTVVSDEIPPLQLCYMDLMTLHYSLDHTIIQFASK